MFELHGAAGPACLAYFASICNQISPDLGAPGDLPVLFALMNRMPLSSIVLPHIGSTDKWNSLSINSLALGYLEVDIAIQFQLT